MFIRLSLLMLLFVLMLPVGVQAQNETNSQPSLPIVEPSTDNADTSTNQAGGGGESTTNNNASGSQNTGTASGTGSTGTAPGTGTPPTTGTRTSINVNFDNPLGVQNVEGLLDRVLTFVQTVVVTLAMIFIVIAGILYITSAGNEKRIESAKNALFAAIIGLAIAIAAPSFLREIYRIFGSEAPAGTPAGSTFLQILLRVLTFLLSIVGVLAIIMLVIGGILFLTSAGDQSRADTARKVVFYSVIGMAVALGALLIVNAITGIF